MIKELNQRHAKDEIYQAMSQIKVMSSSILDGIPALFYQYFWEIIGKDINNSSLNILNNIVNQTTLQPLKVLVESWVSLKAYCYKRYPDSCKAHYKSWVEFIFLQNSFIC